MGITKHNCEIDLLAMVSLPHLCPEPTSKGLRHPNVMGGLELKWGNKVKHGWYINFCLVDIALSWLERAFVFSSWHGL